MPIVGNTVQPVRVAVVSFLFRIHAWSVVS
jgi:hypothetical protein